MSNVLFRLFNVNVNTSHEKIVDENELNVLFIVFFDENESKIQKSNFNRLQN